MHSITESSRQSLKQSIFALVELRERLGGGRYSEKRERKNDQRRRRRPSKQQIMKTVRGACCRGALECEESGQVALPKNQNPSS